VNNEKVMSDTCGVSGVETIVLEEAKSQELEVRYEKLDFRY